MKILDIEELSDISEMKRKDIVAIVQEKYVAPDEASEIRLATALQKGRQVKSLVKWLGWVDKFSECGTTEDGDIKLGEDTFFTVTRYVGQSIHMSRVYGTVLAIHDKSFIVSRQGKLERVSKSKV